MPYKHVRRCWGLYGAYHLASCIVVTQRLLNQFCFTLISCGGPLWAKSHTKIRWSAYITGALRTTPTAAIRKLLNLPQIDIAVGSFAAKSVQEIHTRKSLKIIHNEISVRADKWIMVRWSMCMWFLSETY